MRVGRPQDLERLNIGLAKRGAITMAIEAMAMVTGVEFAKLHFINLAPPDQVMVLV